MVTYFWLVRLYAWMSALVVVIYSIYLITCIHQYCSYSEGCEKFIVFWITSNGDLRRIMKENGDQDELTRLFTLRGVAYVILLIGNAFSLYMAGSFKRRYPQPKNISDFALFFKNVKITQE